ncbi:unnamed protein product, partial [Ilex paraguariensis]
MLCMRTTLQGGVAWALRPTDVTPRGIAPRGHCAKGRRTQGHRARGRRTHRESCRSCPILLLFHFCSPLVKGPLFHFQCDGDGTSRQGGVAAKGVAPRRGHGRGHRAFGVAHECCALDVTPDIIIYTCPV